MRKRVFLGILVGAMLTLSASVMAEETPASAPKLVTSADGALTLQVPGENWKVMEDENHYLALSDGDDVITVDHYKVGDTLPAPAVKDDQYSAVYQAYVSARDDIFAVKGAAVKEEELEKIMQSIGTIQLLKPAAAEPAKTESDFGLRSIGAVYYLTGDDVNVRTGCSTDDESIGKMYKGEELYVDGAVTKDGADYGWYQVKYKDRKAYVSAQFLTDKKPVAASTPSSNSSSNTSANPSNLAYCEYCGQWLEEGNIFRNHVCPNRDAANAAAAADNTPDEDDAYCEYCGQWYPAGNVFRNHICPARDAANAADSQEEETAYCEYCGQWYPVGNIFRNHICPARHAANAED